jgi:hypothetical protein
MRLSHHWLQTVGNKEYPGEQPFIGFRRGLMTFFVGDGMPVAFARFPCHAKAFLF